MWSIKVNTSCFLIKMEFIKPASQGYRRGWVRSREREPSIVPGAGWLPPASLPLEFSRHSVSCLQAHVGTDGIFPISLSALEGSNTKNLQKRNIWSPTKRVIANSSLLYLQDSITKAKLANPCYPRNYVTTFTGGHIFGSLCTEDLRPESYDPNDVITFEGTGNPSLCREKVASLFTFKACHDQAISCFDGVYQPKVKGSFVVRADITERVLRSPWNVYFSPFCFSSADLFPIFFFPPLKPPCYIPFWEWISLSYCFLNRRSQDSTTQPAL